MRTARGTSRVAAILAVVVVGGVLLFGALAYRSSAHRVRTDLPWNVLLITLDTTRADRLGCYGYERDTSPNLDALAEDAVRFDNAMSASAVTPMAHASILTGLYPYEHGLRVFYGRAGYFLSESVPTLAGVLRDHGWHTAAFISAYPASERFGLQWGFDVFESGVDDSVMTEDPAKRPPKEGRWMRRRTAIAQRRADDTTDQALDWLKGAERPFCMWVHYFDPHDVSLVPPAEITELFGVRPGAQNALLAAYDAEIYFMDMQMGRLLDRLRSTGEYDHTIIVVVADHGQGLGQHNWFPHRLLYQEQIRVPMVVRIPGGRHGVVQSGVVRSIDIMPTILDALDIKPAKPVEGKSLRQLMSGQVEQQRFSLSEALNTLDFHAPQQLPARQKDELFCIVEAPWKLIYHEHTPANSELYNLVDDPNELRNVAANNPEQVEQLRSQLEASGIMQIHEVDPQKPMDSDTLEKLRSLGYLPEGG